MSDTPVTILQRPQLPAAEDYGLLRAQGLAAIEALGSRQWTDYNAHDPGITTLEALCYALAELGYRTGFDIADLLTEENGYISFRQALFTARNILTNNALTVNDLRKVLIDQAGVANGWLLCKTCACETTFYAECSESALFHAPQWRLAPKETPQRDRHEHPVHVAGMYDVLLQLDVDPILGNLNHRKILQTLSIPNGDRLSPLTMEWRFPDWQATDPALYGRFIGTAPDFGLVDVRITRFSRDRTLNEPVDEALFVQGWRNSFFVDVEVDFRADAAAVLETVAIAAIPVRFFSPHESVKRAVQIASLLGIMATAQEGGIVDRYRRKLKAVAAAVEQARHALHQVRNLGEDYCRIQGVRTEDIAVCADVEVAPDADIEYVMARIFHEVELHFHPPIPFYSLSERVAQGIPTEDIFEGPPLSNGFIADEDLDTTALRAVVHVSDLYNRIMDIPGLQNIQNLQLTRYDDEGIPLLPSHTWTVPIRPLHIPVLYTEASRLLFYKNGLPFLPRMDEVQAILTQLRGAQSRPKLPLSERDFSIPVGTFRNFTPYTPVQHTLPFTYGTGPHGLPPEANAARRAQAKQLKAYLMPFEQLVGNATDQLANLRDLFSTDESIDRTYFTHFFDPSTEEIAGLADLLTPAATAARVQELAEPTATFLDRRNRVLDHLLARFGEQFREYALLLNANADRIPFSASKLIRDKIRFLRFYPRISANRSRAFNYRDSERICDTRNQAGLAERISRLLGMETLLAYFDITITANNGVFFATFRLLETVGDPSTLLLSEVQPLEASTGQAAEDQAWALIGDIVANSLDAARYVVDGVTGDTLLLREDGTAMARLSSMATVAQVMAFCGDILAKERLYMVEHLLLRPKFPGDALMSVCLPANCQHCGEEDPYSFRLTYVVQGSLAPFNYDMDLRRFADRTIRQETPAHLLPKICWVGNVGFEADPCDGIFTRLALTLGQFLGSDVDEAAHCACAQAVYAAFDAQFQPWIVDEALSLRSRGQWDALLQTLFETITADDIPCLTDLSAAGWAAVYQLLLGHFVDKALYGRQFDRLEAAWCAWLRSNADFDWQVANDLLEQQTRWRLGQALLARGMATNDLCTCVRQLLGYYGDRFRQGIEQWVEIGQEPGEAMPTALLLDDAWTAFRQDIALAIGNDPAFCQLYPLLNDGAFWDDLRALWQPIYTGWIAVSYRLTVLLRVFGELKSIYPTATLHDCDDGADDNPVRLDNTILGTL